MTKGPVVSKVADNGSGLGPYCAACYGPIYLDKIEQGPKIGTRLTYRHVEPHPVCARSAR